MGLDKTERQIVGKLRHKHAPTWRGHNIVRLSQILRLDYLPKLGAHRAIRRKLRRPVLNLYDCESLHFSDCLNETARGECSILSIHAGSARRSSARRPIARPARFPTYFRYARPKDSARRYHIARPGRRARRHPWTERLRQVNADQSYNARMLSAGPTRLLLNHSWP